MKKLILIVSIIVISIISFACSEKSVETTSLPGVEVREYQGKNLSSIDDIKNNAISGTQNIDKDTYRLKVDGLVQKPIELTYEEVLKLKHYKKVVTLNCVEGWSADILWEGVLLSDMINQAGMHDGANTVKFYASDGYTTSLPLDYIMNNNIILAYKMNDVIIPPEKGFPFQLVAEDKLGYKWIKWLTRIELSDDSNYKGYWESRGFSNEGDV